MRDLYESSKNETRPIWCLSFSPNGKFIATGDEKGDVKVSFSKVDYLLNLIALDMDSLSKAC